MRIAAAALVTLALLVAGCGGGEDTSANQSTEPDTTVATEPTGTEGTTTEDTTTEDTTTEGTTTEDDEGGGGDAAAGKAIFAANGCGSCHVLAAAGSNGSVGPNLDETEPSFDKVVERVTNGSGVMPSFADELSEGEIRDVAAFVSESADS